MLIWLLLVSYNLNIEFKTDFTFYNKELIFRRFSTFYGYIINWFFWKIFLKKKYLLVCNLDVKIIDIISILKKESHYHLYLLFFYY